MSYFNKINTQNLDELQLEYRSEYSRIQGLIYKTEDDLDDILMDSNLKKESEDLYSELDRLELELKKTRKIELDLKEKRKEYASNLKSKFLEFLSEKNLKIEDDFYWHSQGRPSEYLYFFDLDFEDGIECFRFSNHPKGENHSGVSKNSGETYSVNYSSAFDIHNQSTLDQALKMVQNSLNFEKRVG